MVSRYSVTLPGTVLEKSKVEVAVVIVSRQMLLHNFVEGRKS